MKVPAWGWAVLAGALLLGMGTACLLAAGLVWYAGGAQAEAAVVTPGLPPLEPASGMLATPEPAQATQVAGGPEQESSGGRRYAEIAGVPLPEGVRAESVVGNEQAFSVITQTPYERVVAFYQQAMPEWGWTRSDRSERLTFQTTQLYFTQDERTVEVTITRAPFVGTIIAVEFS